MLKGTAKVGTDIRRGQISRAALRIIARVGVRGLTTSSIAQEVGISEANIYRHFRNKDEILSVTVEEIGNGLRRNFENVLKTNAADSPLKKLRRAFLLHLDYIEKNGGIPRLVFSDEMHIGNEELKQKLLQSITVYASTLEGLIREGKKLGTIRSNIDPKSSAFMLIGMVQITTLRWSLGGFSFSLVTEGMKLWENYEKCIKTS